MKKLLLALVVGLLLVAGLATLAMADNGPHGGFAASTDACASCHRAHSAAYGSNMLLIASPEALCLSCHDGTGAGTNVEDGVYTNAAGLGTEGTDGASLFGGGFTNTLMATLWSGKYTADSAFDATSRVTTSMHDIEVPYSTIWGSGAANSANGTMTLECVSCHDPHGTAGWVVSTSADGDDTKVASYRLLRWQPQGSNGFTSPGTVNWSGGAFPISDMGTVGGTDVSGWLVPDNFTTNGQEWYTINATNGFAVGDYQARTSTTSSTTVYSIKNPAAAGTNYIAAAVNMAYFCTQCHDRYFANSRLRNNADASAYCGHPLNDTTVSGTVTLALHADADGVAPYIHPVDSVRCEPVISPTTYLITAWGDNGSGDSTYTYMHSSGDLRAAADGTSTAGSGTTVSRSCVACHVSHGTSAQMTASASAASLVTGSTLLRMDNRTICLRCHASTVNYTVAP